jgi:tetrapyrrole methylase family protein/MazG family protein
MLTFESSEKYNVYDLARLVRMLRSEGGCPWDIEQTHESIRRNLLEEAYEAAEAIDERDALHLREELGDVLTQVVFHADIERELGSFDLDDVADAVVRKLLYRHPHVFGDVTADTSDEVMQNWDELKKREKSHDTVSEALDAVAKALPALWRAEKVMSKAIKAGFSFVLEDGYPGGFAGNASGDAFAQIGDKLFAAVGAAKSCGVDPEDALNAATDRFIERFRSWESTNA